MNLAVIGAGNWGKNLVKTLHGMGVLTAVAEASEALRDQLAKDYPQLELVANYGELFGRQDVNAVAIATPAATHHKIARDFLQAGKDVFVEKPMTLTAAESEDLVATARRSGRILMVGHLLLYKPALDAIRQFLASGRMGRIFTLHQERAKLGKARSVENALWSLGVHDVAALLHLVGETPDSVAFHGHRGLQPNVEDDTYLHMTFPSGIQAHLHNSWLWPEDCRRLVIVGENGMVVYDEKAETVRFVRKSVDSRLNNVDQGEELLYEQPEEGAAPPLLLEMEHFLTCIKTRATPRSDGQNGLDVVRVLELAAHKARHHNARIPPSWS
jgi:predicted dehydrogenase